MTQTNFAVLSGLLKEQEAADYLRVKPRTLRDWRVRGVRRRFNPTMPDAQVLEMAESMAELRLLEEEMG